MKNGLNTVFRLCTCETCRRASTRQDTCKDWWLARPPHRVHQNYACHGTLGAAAAAAAADGLRGKRSGDAR